MTVPAARLTIVEGAYAAIRPCGTAMICGYSLPWTLPSSSAAEARSGPEKLRIFRDRWIPLEESCFTAFDLPARCDMALKG